VANRGDCHSTYTDVNIDLDRDPYPDSYMDTYANTDSYVDTYANPDSHVDTDANTDSYVDADTHTYVPIRHRCLQDDL
jgi:hypothetical protein